MTSDGIFDMQATLRAAENAAWERDMAIASLDRMLIHIPTYDLVREHQERTMICSVSAHMERCSGPIMVEILRRCASPVVGVDDVPWNPRHIAEILSYLQNHIGESGMSLMLLLWRATGEDPARDYHVSENGWEKFIVSDCVDAWLQWGCERALIS